MACALGCWKQYVPEELGEGAQTENIAILITFPDEQNRKHNRLTSGELLSNDPHAVGFASS